jgi:hypothetical protein
LNDAQELKNITHRLKKLERRNTFSSLLIFLLVIGIGASLYPQYFKRAAGPGVQGGIINAEKIFIRDSADRVRVALQISQNGAPVFQLTDGEGRSRFQVELEPDGTPLMSFFASDQKPRSTFGLNKDYAEVNFYGQKGNVLLKQFVLENETGSRIALYDNNQQRRVTLGSNSPEGLPYFRLNGKDSEHRAILTLNADQPILVLNDSGGKNRAIFGLKTTGDPILNLKDKESLPRMLIDLDADGWPSLAFRDPGKHDRLWLTLDPNDEPYLAFFDPGNTNRILLGVKGKDKPFLAFKNREGKTTRLLSDQPKK